MEPERQLPPPQGRIIKPCHEPNNFSPRPNTFSSYNQLTLFFHAHLEVFEIFGTQAKFQHAFPMRATSYTHRLYPP